MIEHIAQARAAIEAVAAAEQVAGDARAKIAELQRLERSEQAEREKLRELEDEAEAMRQLDGEGAAPVDAERVERLAQLDRSVPARVAAIRIQRERVDTAEATLQKSRGVLAGPALHVIAEMQADATAAIRSIMAQLAPEFARLIASDHIRNNLLGERFAVPAGCPLPIGGLRTVETFAKALPDRMKPPELANVLLFEAANAVSSEILNQIKG